MFLLVTGLQYTVREKCWLPEKGLKICGQPAGKMEDSYV